MRITCPYCHSTANLSPNPAFGERMALPHYLLDCSGCSHTIVPRDPPPGRRVPGRALFRRD